MIINVTNLAKAGIAHELNPQYQTGLYYFQFFQIIPLSPADFVDDATTEFMAGLLGGQVVKLQPRVLWQYGVPNSSPLSNLPKQNFVGFPNQPGAQNGQLLVVNAGDLAQAATQAFTFGLTPELAVEQALAYVIPGSVMSPAAQAALATSPISSWPPQSPVFYTPGS